MKSGYIVIIVTCIALLASAMALTAVAPSPQPLHYTPTIGEWLDVYLNATCRCEYPNCHLRFVVFGESRLVVMITHIDDPVEKQKFSMPGTVKYDPISDFNAVKLRLLLIKAKEYCARHGFKVEERSE